VTSWLINCRAREGRSRPILLLITDTVASLRVVASLIDRALIPNRRVADSLGDSRMARLVEEGPIPAVDGVVRWRACDLIMRLYEEFRLSVSDDTVYRALKDLGFSHVSARPKAYKQDADAMEAFKKTLPTAWRKSVPSSRRVHL
jgi:hypothetical protein